MSDMDDRRMQRTMGKGIAPGKTILFGEHAVVYGEPGIAIPLWNVQTTASFQPLEKNKKAQGFWIISSSAGLDESFSDLSDDLPLKKLIVNLLEVFQIPVLPQKAFRIESTIPIASGLGSGAACSVAVTRAFAAEYGKQPDDSEVSAIAFEIEKYYHGSPSGLDNTTISHGKPVYFRKGIGFELLQLPLPLNLVIADTGIKSITSEVVGDIRTHSDQLKPFIHTIGKISNKARISLETGDIRETGALMNENQQLLQKMSVSCQELDKLIGIALENGAIGAKLTGAGRGGNIIALAEDTISTKKIKTALENAGAKVIS